MIESESGVEAEQSMTAFGDPRPGIDLDDPVQRRVPYTQLEVFDCIYKGDRYFSLAKIEPPSGSASFVFAVEQLGLSARGSELGELQEKGFDGMWWRGDCHLRAEWGRDALPVGGWFSKYRFDEPGPSPFEVCAHADSGHAAASTGWTSQGSFDEPVQGAVERFCEPDRIGEVEGDANWAWSMPGADRVDSSCRGPGEGISAVFAELCDQSGFRKTAEFAQCLDAEAFQSLDDERIDGQRSDRARREE